MATMHRLRFVLLAILLGVSAAAAAGADPRSQALRREGYEAAYNLDYDQAIDLFKQAIAADPTDAAAQRAIAAITWLRVLFLRGTILVDDYLGHVSTSSDVAMPKPPAALDAAFHEHTDRAIALAEKEVSRQYNRASPHYDLGASLGLYASYTGTVEGHVFSALRSARRAFSEHEMVLDIDPGRKDAGLIVGTYRYLVSTLPLAVRVMAYIVGFGGGRERGISLVEEAAAYPSDVQTDARFALVLIYNRERRYADALGVIHVLERGYPRNRLLYLEEGATFVRARRPQDAVRVLDEAMARLPADTRVRMPGEEARWRYERGNARLLLGRLAEAADDLRAALAVPGSRDWVLARIHVALGKVEDLRGDRARARNEYQAALVLLEKANDPEARDEATRYLSQPYRQ